MSLPESSIIDPTQAITDLAPVIINPALATIDRLELPEFAQRGIRVDILRLDRIHPVVSGNKWFKLKEHLRIALEKRNAGIVTFGGAWSNHIVATAYAAQSGGFFAPQASSGGEGRNLVGYPAYRRRLWHASRIHQPHGIRDEGRSGFPGRACRVRIPNAYILPEGGSGPAGIKGSEEIGRLAGKAPYSHILCAIGTGTMFLGLARAAAPQQKIIGIPVLKGLHHFLADRAEWIGDPERLARCRIGDGYHFGGYARKTEELLRFMRRLYACTGIPTDFVYTGKLLYAVLDMANKGAFPPGSGLLVIHSGGLQGNRSLPPATLDF